ncbi:MAG: prepilin-type N-terminal cleavage/methylation domain-containing protein [PVC group bacterium]|nr:prepilin-type N-terminal cleavage/methylation domain-containing protein [PVC group bacterium]
MISPIGKNNGFTLIELLSVILLLVVLITLSVPTMAKTARSFYFRNKVKTITALLEYVRKTSIVEERTYKFIIDSETNSYEIKYEDLTLLYDDKFKAVNNSIMRSQTLPEGFNLKTSESEEETEEILFTSEGGITHIELYIHDQKNHLAKITTTVSGEISAEFLQ